MVTQIFKSYIILNTENLLQYKYQENKKICLNTPGTQKNPQLLTPTNDNKKALQEIKTKYFQKKKH